MPFSFIDAISASAACSAGIEYIASTSSILVSAAHLSGLWGPAAPLGPVAAPLVPRSALLPAPTPRVRAEPPTFGSIRCHLFGEAAKRGGRSPLRVPSGEKLLLFLLIAAKTAKEAASQHGSCCGQ